MRFFVFLSIVACTPWYLTSNLSLAIYIVLEFAPVSCGGGKFAFWRLFCYCGFTFGSCLPMDTSASDHRCRSCINSAGSGSFVRFFLSKHACYALSQFKLLGELLVATFKRGVFGFRFMCASNSETSVTPFGVIFNVFVSLPHRK